MSYTLYWAPNTCSLAPHIVLRESGLPFELVQVNLREKQLAGGGDWLAINPKGYVPALRLPDKLVLTENAVMIQYLADQAPEKNLAPASGSIERVRLAEWVHFIATELHKGMGPLYNPLANEDYKAQLKAERLTARWTTLAAGIGDKPYLTGDFTVADAYAFYCMRAWRHAQGESFSRWPGLEAYYDRTAARPTVAAAMAAEGIAP